MICVSNNEEILHDFLQKSLAAQKVEHELIVVDNSEGKWTSAASALNWGASTAKGDLLMFVHQDFDLESEDWLSECERLCGEIENLGAAGAAGRREGSEIISNIKDRWPTPKRVSQNEVKTATKVQTLDECLIVVPRKVFERHQFDESTCSNWHLYAVDLSLSLIESGLGVFVLPLPGYHRSNNQSLKSGDYFETMKRVLEKHKEAFPKVYTTCGTWSLGSPMVIQKIKLMMLTRLMRHEEGD